MRVAMAMLVSACLVGCASQAPPLIRGAHATSGYGSACPGESRFQQTMPFAVSPEIHARLNDKFPAGSSSTALAAWLTTEQGFKIFGRCGHDTSVTEVSYRGPSGGLGEAHAAVYWMTSPPNPWSVQNWS